ncbi:MAG: branched-chain amino acid aminotransferase [Melioribacteraceae bacterium]|nr:branched-chain amino acid aminotransferase [Melioribacteraceae bacterium]
MVNINYETEDQSTKVELPENLIFGRMMTNHIFVMDYDEALGWHNPTIKKLSKLELSPAAMVLHYGQTIFEGLKAYKQVDGRIAMFRPERNFERMNNSARRLVMPEVDNELVLNGLKELVKIEKDWIPTKPGHALYIRPLMFATDPFLGVRTSDSYKFIIMLSPVGPYYPEGFKPVPILATDKYVRAVRKGIGDCKTAGNYAASLLAQREAKREGFSQVLWLDAIEQKYIEEVGTMNIFVQFKDEVTTPMLTGSILPGITRMSVLQILKDWNYNVTERMISIDEVVDGYENGNLIEIFGTGTAAVISSVGKLKYKDKLFTFGDEEAGELGTKLYKEITGIQYGRIEDRYGWMTYLN